MCRERASPSYYFTPAVDLVPQQSSMLPAFSVKARDSRDTNNTHGRTECPSRTGNPSYSDPLSPKAHEAPGPGRLRYVVVPKVLALEMSTESRKCLTQKQWRTRMMSMGGTWCGFPL